jgi:hypothetical protein
MQAELVLSCSEKNGDHFMFCSCTHVKHAQCHISCIATPQQCTWTFVTYYYLHYHFTAMISHDEPNIVGQVILVSCLQAKNLYDVREELRLAKFER